MPLAPLYLVAGAPGAGKTTLLPELIRQGAGLVVIDMDELLEDGALLGVPIADPAARPIWPAYDRMWRRIANIIRRAGHPVLLLLPAPAPEDLAEGASWDEPARWVLLDCPDRVRLERLRARGWSPALIDDAMDDAARTRALLPEVIRDAGEAPDRIAERVLRWVAEPD